MGCNFCTTSAFFGGKGKILNLYSTGEELFRLMEEAEASRKVKSFFIMDENFLLQKQRAMELLGADEGGGQELGASTSSLRRTRSAKYTLRGTGGAGDLLDLDGAGIAALRVRQAGGRRHAAADAGIAGARHRAAGLHHCRAGAPHPGEHRRGDRARRRARDGPAPVHALHAGAGHAAVSTRWRSRAGCSDVDLADIHGQYAFNFQHAAISREQSKQVPGLGVPARLRAQRAEPVPHLPHDLRRLEAVQEPSGPARARALSSARRGCCGTPTPACSGPWSTGCARRTNRESPQIRALRKDIEREFGIMAVAASRSLGPVLWWTSRREEKRLARGKHYEPATIIDRRNWVEG